MRSMFTSFPGVEKGREVVIYRQIIVRSSSETDEKNTREKD